MTDVACDVESDLDVDVDACGWEETDEVEGTSKGGRTGLCLSEKKYQR